MSLKFHYNNTHYVWIPVIRTVTKPLRAAILEKVNISLAQSVKMSSDITIDTDYSEEVEARKDPYIRTGHYVTANEAQAFMSTNGSETYFSVVRNPLDRCISLYNYMIWCGWCANTTFSEYWTDIINNPVHNADVAPGARSTQLQKDIVKTSGTIYKFETDLDQLSTDFGISLGPINDKSNVVTDEEKEKARTLIETHFNDDYVEFNYTKGE